MSGPAIVWTATGVLLAVALALAVQRLLRAMRELNRMKSRLQGLRELPVVEALRKGEADALRLQGALAQIEPLVVRAQVALATIGRGPLPPEVVAAYVRVRDEIVAFRRFRSGRL